MKKKLGLLRAQSNNNCVKGPVSMKDEYVVVGKVGTPYGIKGWLKIVSFTESKADILEYNPWYLADGHHWKLTQVETGRVHGKGIVAKLAGLNNPEQARLLTGKNIAVMRSVLPTLKKNEYYWSDLEGLTVINQHGETLGKVTYLIATGSNDVLVIKGDKEYGIPYLPGDVVTSIDLKNKVMHVKWELI